MDNEKSNQSIVNFAFVVMAFLAYLIVAVLFQTLAEAFGPVQRLHAISLLQHGIPVPALVITFCSFCSSTRGFTSSLTKLSLRSEKSYGPRKKTPSLWPPWFALCAWLRAWVLAFFDFVASQLIKIFVGV